jgi:hypothetical protein
MLVRLGFSTDAAGYLTRDAGISSLEEIDYLDVDEVEVEVLINRLNHPGRIATFGTGDADVKSPHDGYAVFMRAESNLKLSVFYLKHQEIVSREHNVRDITLTVVCVYHDQQKWEEEFKKTVVEPVINDKDWLRTLENIWDYLASILSVNGVHLAYVTRTEITVPDAYDDPEHGHLTAEQEMIH